MNKGQKRAKAEFNVLDRIKSERDKRNWTDYEMAENSGLTTSTISTWFNRGIEPGIASIEKLCNGFGISLSEFFSTEKASFLTKEQSEILDIWSSLSPKQRTSIITMIKTFMDK